MIVKVYLRNKPLPTSDKHLLKITRPLLIFFAVLYRIHYLSSIKIQAIPKTWPPTTLASHFEARCVFRLHLNLSMLACLFCMQFSAQSANQRINTGELSMKFPGIYFKNNSTEFAQMPYSVDSCLNYISKQISDINCFVLWRDSAETEKLSSARRKKIEALLKAYGIPKKITIYSMGSTQKIANHTIHAARSSSQKQFLLSLNSVFEFSRARPPQVPSVKKICWHCIIHLRPCQVNRYLFYRIKHLI